eukprot:2842446-Rhodomonas_salina.2
MSGTESSCRATRVAPRRGRTPRRSPSLDCVAPVPIPTFLSARSPFPVLTRRIVLLGEGS